MRTHTMAVIAISGIILGCIVTFDAAGGMLPGDIAAAAGTPLVAAHSMTRALYSTYNGRLFQVRRASDSKTKDIGVTGAGGYVNMDTLNDFCSGTTCTVSELYDQSGNANNLTQATVDSQPGLAYWSISNSTLVPMAVTVNHQFLRNRTSTTKIPTGSESQTEYFVVQGLYYNGGCCYDYGNMENTVHDNGSGTMDALYFGSSTGWTTGAGPGPWGMADMENNLFAGPNKNNPGNPTTLENLVMVLSKTNGTTSWALKVGDASAGPLNTYYSGNLPNGYSPLHQQGGLSLGEGGDGSNRGSGAFFEGVVIADLTSDATDSLIHVNLTSVYGTSQPDAFTPAADPSLETWWDGNDTSTMTFSSGMVVQTWTDKSSHHYAATQGTASQRPTYVPDLLNGKGGLRFTRTNNSLLTSTDNDNAFSRGFSVFYVIQPLSMPADNLSVLTQSTSTVGEPGLGFTSAGANAIAEFGFSETGGALKNASFVPYIDEFVSATGAPLAGGAFKATPYVNGAAGSALDQTISHAYTATGLHIGSDKFDDSYDGYIYEIVVSSDTTMATRQKYEGYFACKYGLLGFLPAGDFSTAVLAPTRRQGVHPAAVFSRSGFLYINVPGEKARVCICNLLGRSVYERTFTGLNPGRAIVIDLHRDINGRASSMLFVNVETGGKTMGAMVPVE